MYVYYIYLYCAPSIEVQWLFRGIRDPKIERREGERDTCVTYKIYSNGTDIAVCVCIILPRERERERERER